MLSPIFSPKSKFYGNANEVFGFDYRKSWTHRVTFKGLMVMSSSGIASW